MTTSPDPPRNWSIELLRWVCVLPAAVLAAFVTKWIVRLVSSVIIYGWGSPAESDFVHWALVLLHYPTKEFAFIAGGAVMAPRARPATAIVLAAAAILASLAIHLLGQVGFWNYTHFGLESAGAVLGVAFVIYAKSGRVGLGPPSF